MMFKSAIVATCLIVLVCLLATVATATKPASWRNNRRPNLKEFLQRQSVSRNPWIVRPRDRVPLAKPEPQSDNLLNPIRWSCYQHSATRDNIGADSCSANCRYGYKGPPIRVRFSYHPSTWGTIGTIDKWICQCCTAPL